MSKHQAIKAIRSEIDLLNQDIDLRIIKGVPYRRQAVRHKFLMGQLSRLAPKRTSWLGRVGLGIAFRTLSIRITSHVRFTQEQDPQFL